MENDYYNVGEPKDFILKFLNNQFGEQLTLDEQTLMKELLKASDEKNHAIVVKTKITD